VLEDLRGEMEIVNSKSEDEDDENEWDGDEGSVYDFDSFALFLVLLFPISALFFSTTSYIVAQYCALEPKLERLLNYTIYNRCIEEKDSNWLLGHQYSLTLHFKMLIAFKKTIYLRSILFWTNEISFESYTK